MSVLSIALNPTIDISSHVEQIEPTRKLRTFKESQSPGGGGVNVARVMCILGAHPALLVLTGGAVGAQLDEALYALPLDVHRISITQSTRIAFTVHEDRTGLEYRFVPEGPIIAASEFELALNLVASFQGNYVVASGSLPRGIGHDAYHRIAVIAQANNARFILDTSGEALRETLESTSVFMFKPSVDELEMLVERRLDETGIRQAAMSFIESGKANYVVVSLGREGSMLAGPDGIIRQPAMRVITHSTVGAGDCFVGAMVWRLEQGAPMEEAFRFGAAAGTAAVMSSGAVLCRNEDIYAVYDMMKAAASRHKAG